MLSVSICDISGKYHSSNGFVFLVATNALGIEAASFASHAGRGAGIGSGKWEREMGAGWRWSEQRYSGKPDGKAGTPTLNA